MRPRRGVSLTDATHRLNALAMEGRNVQSGIGFDVGRGRNSFLGWVSQVERALTELFDDAQLEHLQTPRYWGIQSMTSDKLDRMSY